MGRNKIPVEERKLRGNPGRHDLPEETEIDSLSIQIPPGLSKMEKKYWKRWAPALILAGKLTEMSLPAFLDLIELKVRLDQVNEFIDGNNKSLLEEKRFVDSSGQEHIEFRESAYSKISRSYTVILHKLEKSWGLTADSMAGVFKARPKKSAIDDFMPKNE